MITRTDFELSLEALRERAYRDVRARARRRLVREIQDATLMAGRRDV